MKFVVLCKVDGGIEIVRMPGDCDFHWFGQKIGADMIETVYPKGLKDPYMVLCDEEGLLKDRPVINVYGSWLYETQDHGEPIVGDILIVKQILTPDGADFDGMPENEADVIAEWLLDHFKEAYTKVIGKILPSTLPSLE